MDVLKLALRNVRGNPVKSVTVFLSVFGLAAFFVATTLIVRGAQDSLSKGVERLGADLLVVPEGAESKLENALLMGTPTKIWMPAETLGKVASVAGVDRASPQVYLQSLFGASCCAVDEMFMVVFDPATDFSVTPWLDQKFGRGLKKGEVIGGTYIFLMEGEEYLKLYGYNLELKGTLEPTGMGIDQTLFMTNETALELAKWSGVTAERPLVIPQDSISSVLVKVKPGVDPHAVAVKIQEEVPGVVAIESPNLFGTFRKQMMGLLWIFVIVLVLAYIMSGVLIGLVFSMAAHERRREMALLRASGATPLFLFRALWTEAALLALSAGVAGSALASVVVYFFRGYIENTLGMPFLFPSGLTFVTLIAVALVMSLVTVSLAVLAPAYRVSQQEPAVAMKE